MTPSSVLRAVARGLRRADGAAGRLLGGRAVLVEVRTPMNLAVLRPVYEPLMADPRVRVRFTAVPRPDIARAFAELRLTPRVISRARAAWTRFDLYFNADPWEAVPLRRTARQLNFFHGVAGKYDLDCPRTLPLGFDRYDCVAFPNESRLSNYVAAGIVAPARAALVGYPKVDALVRDAGSARDGARELGLDPSRPTAIYAPTFSPASSLAQAGEAIVEALLQTGCNVIAKLHDRSLDPDPRYSGGENWRERLARFASPGRFLLAETGDSTPCLLASEVLVTDHSSIGFEACAADRPVIVFDAPGLIEAARINPEKVALLRSAATVVRRATELPEAVAEALRAPGRLSAERRRVAAEVFHRPGSATARALQIVYDLLELPPPLHSPAAAEAWSAAE